MAQWDEWLTTLAPHDGQACRPCMSLVWLHSTLISCCTPGAAAQKCVSKVVAGRPAREISELDAAGWQSAACSFGLVACKSRTTKAESSDHDLC